MAEKRNGYGRTGGRWPKTRDKVRALSIEQGIFNCPLCRVGLDYEYSGQRNSAEVDHIIPWSKGGSDELSNLRVICRRCNQKLGGKDGAAKTNAKRNQPKPLKTSPRWQ